MRMLVLTCTTALFFLPVQMTAQSDAAGGSPAGVESMLQKAGKLGGYNYEKATGTLPKRRALETSLAERDVAP